MKQSQFIFNLKKIIIILDKKYKYIIDMDQITQLTNEFQQKHIPINFTNFSECKYKNMVLINEFARKARSYYEPENEYDFLQEDIDETAKILKDIEDIKDKFIPVLITALENSNHEYKVIYINSLRNSLNIDALLNIKEFNTFKNKYNEIKKAILFIAKRLENTPPRLTPVSPVSPVSSRSSSRLSPISPVSSRSSSRLSPISPVSSRSSSVFSTLSRSSSVFSTLSRSSSRLSPVSSRSSSRLSPVSRSSSRSNKNEYLEIKKTLKQSELIDMLDKYKYKNLHVVKQLVDKINHYISTTTENNNLDTLKRIYHELEMDVVYLAKTFQDIETIFDKDIYNIRINIDKLFNTKERKYSKNLFEDLLKNLPTIKDILDIKNNDDLDKAIQKIKKDLKHINTEMSYYS
jgi:hypothetical protein